MSGLNKQKKSKKYIWRKSFYLLTCIYLSIVVVLALGAYKLPSIYEAVDSKRTEQIKENIEQVLQNKDRTAQEKQLHRIATDHHIDLVILTDDGFEFKTTKTSDFEVLQTDINTKLLSYQSSYHLKLNDVNYRIWLAVYQMEPQAFFEVVISLLVFSVLLLFTLLSSLIFIMFKKLIEPINRLKNNILKLKHFQFEDVSNDSKRTEYDAISEELSEFTDDLQGKIDNFGINYTLLEKELQAEKEKLIYKNQSLGTMVHHLKTPNALIALYAQQALMQTEDEATKAIIQKMQEQNQLLLTEIKEIVKLSHETATEKQPENMDVITVAREVLQRFEDLLRSKDILYNLDAPRHLAFTMDLTELKQLLYNMMSNAAQYTPVGGNIELTIYQKNQQLHIEAFNDIEQDHGIDFEQVFNLFYSNQGEKNGFGTGIGLYTIKNTVEKNHGSCTFTPVEAGVRLEIILPFGDENDEEI
ncbi:sensor histidine kinase [Isobaculum melis]|uniref:histidine kinase n=1 Tax=Isobaculum melis TaxID=142588 RepID=A0A1H9SW98_9LACT|nr:HAMP domain-containing sensor histidine kinase [Isobaculum melis]SER89168.1 Signal transduction histidine kinase [Isobaculum melis]